MRFTTFLQLGWTVLAVKYRARQLYCPNCTQYSQGIRQKTATHDVIYCLCYQTFKCLRHRCYSSTWRCWKLLKAKILTHHKLFSFVGILATVLYLKRSHKLPRSNSFRSWRLRTWIEQLDVSQSSTFSQTRLKHMSASESMGVNGKGLLSCSRPGKEVWDVRPLSLRSKVLPSI